MSMWRRCRELLSRRFHPSDEQLVAWILKDEQGALPEAGHLSRCPHCQRRLQRFRETLGMLERLWPQPHGEEEEIRNLHASLMQRLKESASPVNAATERRLLGKAAEDPRYREAVPEILRTLVGPRALARASRTDAAAAGTSAR